jgi:hypothetical protein
MLSLETCVNRTTCVIGSVSDALTTSELGLGTPSVFACGISAALATGCCSKSAVAVEVSDFDARRGHLAEPDLVLRRATEGGSEGSSRSATFGNGRELRFELLRGGTETVMGPACL